MAGRRSLIALAALAALVLAACGGTADVGAGGPESPAGEQSPAPGTADPASPVGTVPPDRFGPDGGASPDAEEVQARPGQTQDAAPRPFDRARVDEEAGTLTLWYWTGVEPCHVLDHVEVDYRPAEVVVTVLEGTTDPDAVCIQIARYVRTTVELSEPVGDRPIVDGGARKEPASPGGPQGSGGTSGPGS